MLVDFEQVNVGWVIALFHEICIFLTKPLKVNWENNQASRNHSNTNHMSIFHEVKYIFPKRGNLIQFKKPLVIYDNQSVSNTWTKKYLCWHAESVTGRCSVVKVFLLKFLFNVSGLQTCKFIKKGLQHRCFRVNFAKFLRTTIL